MVPPILGNYHIQFLMGILLNAAIPYSLLRFDSEDSKLHPGMALF